MTFNGEALRITSFVGEHNHTVSKDVFKCLPRQRVLSEEKQSEIKQFLDMRCNKKLLKEYVSSTLNQTVTLKDLHNIKTKQGTTSSTEELSTTVDYLKTVDSATVEVLVNGNDFEGLYFQTAKMKKVFADYPDIFLLDATYCLNNLSMPFYIIMVVNGNGQVVVACTFLLAHENATNIEKMLSIFKSHNPKFSDVKTVFTDKDFKERAALRMQLPSAKILLCLFHTLRTFKRNITFEKMGLKSNEKNEILKIIQKLTYSKNREEYNEHYQSLLECNFGDKEKLITYYNTNWHSICDEWVVGLMKKNYTMNIVTTNHLESLNQKIKQVVVKNSSLLVFYKDLMEVFSSIHNESKVRATQMVAKQDIKYPKGSLEEKYANHLTPFAASFVLKALEKSKTLDSLEADTNCTSTTCECDSFKNIELPCCHIFFKRNQNNESMFYEVVPKFTKDFHPKHFSIDEDNVDHANSICSQEGQDIIIHQHIEKCKSILSKNEKYRKALEICQDICSNVADYGNNDF